ncbi:MAG TPA: hypothetical protein VK645_15890 [Chitinophagaceae bacterium]|nr:hypothetical protein [Chitinophagaceae bacterium]
MRKLIFWHIVLIAVFVSCKKTDSNSSKNPDAAAKNELIAGAQNYFNSTFKDKGTSRVTSQLSNRSGLVKTPVWDKAYILEQPDKERIVVVPLHYDRSISGKAGFAAGQTLSLEKSSALWIYKNKLNQYTAEVVVTFPDTYYQGSTSKGFSGYVLKETWAGDNTSIIQYSNEKTKKVRSYFRKITVNSINALLPSDNCVAVDWYSCESIDNGIGTNCDYLYTEYFCNDGSGGDGGQDGGGGGSSPPEYEEESTKAADYAWVVQNVPAQFGNGYLLQTDHLVAKFYSRHPQYNRFVGGNSSHINLYSNSFGSNGTITFSNTLTHVTVNSNTQATISSSGAIRFLNVNVTFDYSGSKSVSLSEVDWQ